MLWKEWEDEIPPQGPSRKYMLGSTFLEQWMCPGGCGSPGQGHCKIPGCVQKDFTRNMEFYILNYFCTFLGQEPFGKWVWIQTGLSSFRAVCVSIKFPRFLVVQCEVSRWAWSSSLAGGWVPSSRSLQCQRGEDVMECFPQGHMERSLQSNWISAWSEWTSRERERSK